MSGNGRRHFIWASWLIMLLVLIAALAIGVSDDAGPQNDAERANAVARTIRCPQCRSESVAESNVGIAREIRADIARRIDTGETDDQIRQAYVDRYDESILLTPSGTGFTGLVWVIPVLAAALAVIVVGLAFSRWRRESGAEVSADDRRIVEAAREPPQ
jgi:cytochrome c-type biogenesis protein CcmH/NrfF